jgi:protein-tyrosine phosphatase
MKNSSTKIDEIKTIRNFRDFGGFPFGTGNRIKSGIIFRSGDLAKINDNDIRIIKTLNLKSIIDLRSPEERKKDSFRFTTDQMISIPFSYSEISRERLKPFMFKNDVDDKIIEAMNSIYIDMTDQLFPQLKSLFQILISKESYPLLIHCHAGKDRTGFVCAIIQLLLGVENGLIISEYLKSNDFLMLETKRRLIPFKIFSLGFFPTHNFQLIFSAQERYIDTILNKINNQYGGITKYLEIAGISRNDQDIITNLLLEK